MGELAKPLSDTGLLSVGFRQFGSQEELKENAIMHLYHLYVKVNAQASEEIAKHIKESRAARRAAGEEGVPADDAAPTRPEEEAANAASPTHTAARKVFEAMENGQRSKSLLLSPTANFVFR